MGEPLHAVPNSRPFPKHPVQAGWELLLGPLTGKSVVCLDDGGTVIAALAQRCQRVLLVSATPERAAQNAAHAADRGWSHVEVVAQQTLADSISVLGSGRFDGLVVCALADRRSASFPGSFTPALEQARALLRDGAFVLVAATNRWGLSRDSIGSGFSRRGAWSWLSLSRLVRSLGAQDTVVYPVLTDDRTRITEVIAPSGYRATKNVGAAIEVAKQWLWGARTARWFAPALVCVAWIGPAPTKLIDRVADALPHPLGRPRWVQCLVLMSGKVIASFDSGAEHDARRVVVVTRDGLAVERRTHEADVLRQLAVALPASLSALLPAVLDRFALDGNECFVLQHIPGVTADSVVPELDRVTQKAVQFLLALHQATCTKRVMSAEGFASVLAPIFASAIKRNHIVAAELRQLELLVFERLVGQTWVAVCSHGDFKIENVIYDPRSFEITGVIDWEHAMLDGLPYIDLVYLLTYNRMLRGQSWAVAARSLLMGQTSAEEEALKARYWKAFGFEDRLAPILRTLAIVHHIGVRWHGQWAGKMKEELVALLHTCVALLQAEPKPASSNMTLAPTRSTGAGSRSV